MDFVLIFQKGIPSQTAASSIFCLYNAAGCPYWKVMMRNKISLINIWIIDYKISLVLYLYSRNDRGFFFPLMICCCTWPVKLKCISLLKTLRNIITNKANWCWPYISAAHERIPATWFVWFSSSSFYDYIPGNEKK